MPGQGPLTGGSFNVGRDLTLQVVVNGQSFNNLGLLTDANRKVLSHMHEVIPVNNDGIPVRRTTYSGYDFEFHFTRQSGLVDSLVRELQRNYYSGGNPPKITMTETIRNPDQSVNQTSYTGGTIVPETLGSFKGADPVNDVHLRIVFSQANDIGGLSPQALNLGSNPFVL